MHTIHSLLAAIGHHPEIDSLPFLTLLMFLRYAHHLKDDVLQPQPHFVSVTTAPKVLLPSIASFLSKVLGISLEATEVLWPMISEVVWGLPTPEEADTVEGILFDSMVIHTVSVSQLFSCLSSLTSILLSSA